MHGVLGLLTSTTTPKTKPLELGPSWSPTSTSTPESTQPLFLKKKPLSDDDNNPRTLSNFSTPSPKYSLNNSPPSSSSLNRISRKSVNLSESGWKPNSGLLNTRDELLMSLMASEAVVDSREFDILTAEEVEDYKKEHQLLTSRLGAMTKKLALETKIRDAALSLCKVNASHKKVSQQTTDQLNAANARVESAQNEYWKVSDRANDVYKKLMEHRAGVLSFSVRSIEKKLSPQMADDSGYDSSNRNTLASPSSTPSKSRFDGAHLFAGHADTIVPKRKLSAEDAAAEIVYLEEKLQVLKDSLTAAGKRQAEMARELSMVRLEKQEVETMMGLDLQAAEETIAALDKEIPRLEMLDSEVRQLRAEKVIWEQERAELIEREKEAEILQARLADMMTKTGEVAGDVSLSSTTTSVTSDNVNTDVQRIISILQPLWAILPSPEARAAKFGNTNQRSYRTGSPTPSSSNTSAPSPISSLSELDVRSLKSLYDATRQTPTSPVHHNGTFTIEEFVGQVQALINDDRALIERLLRFAQAHDMLKKNADRAQKLAREGTLALETYQKQVRMLEERNIGTVAKQAAYQDEIQRFQSTIDRLEFEKRQLESLAAEQAETCAQLNDANNILSARTLTLAEEAAKAPEMVRKQLDAQLNECRKALDVARGEVDEMRSSEQSQNIVLLDELNEMQKENANLRAQLRAIKK